MNYKDRNSMQSKTSHLIKKAVTDGCKFSVQKKETYLGTNIVVRIEDAYYLTTISYMKRSLPLCPPFWSLVEHCGTDEFDTWEERALLQYKKQDSYKCKACCFTTNFKSLAARHARVCQGCHFEQLEKTVNDKRPLQEHYFKKPRGRPPVNKTWSTKRGCWEDALNSEDSEAVNDDFDTYGHDAKLIQRMSFATMCKKYEDKAGEFKNILYLDTASGSMTALLLQFFEANQLHPCNRDAWQTTAISKRYPNVNTKTGMIEDLHLNQLWLGVWYDMEETWCERDSPGQPWKFEKIPNFRQAIVNAVTLSAHGMIGGAEGHAVELQKLIEDKGGQTPSLTSACDGMSGKMTMVFGIGIFERDLQPEAEDYLFCHLRVPRSHFQEERWYKDYDWSMYAIDYEDNLSATVVGVNKDRLTVRFMNKYGFMFKDNDEWTPTVKEIACMLSYSRSPSA